MKIDNSTYRRARQLQKQLGYTEWRHFERIVILKAQAMCLAEGASIEEHFIAIKSPVNLGNKAKRKILDFDLSPYACELIKKNCTKYHH